MYQRQKIVTVLLILALFGSSVNAFNYSQYIEKRDLANTKIETFDYLNQSYSIIFVNNNPTFLVRTLKNGTHELVLENDKDFSNIVEAYVEYKMNYSDMEVEKLKTLIDKYNESLHNKATIQSMEFPDPFFFCGRQFGIDIYQNKDCTSKASCQTIVSVYCAARPGYCPDISELSNNLFQFIDAGRSILKNLVLFKQKLNNINVTSKTFKSQVNELINITKTLQMNSDTILKSKMRFPEKGISECPDCYGTCPYVPINKTTLVEIEKILTRWKNSTVDRETIETLLYLGLEKVRKIDKERKIAELKILINETEKNNNAEELLQKTNQQLNKVDDAELKALNQNVLNLKAEVENSASFAQEVTFKIKLSEYEEALKKLSGYDFSKYDQKIDTIKKNDQLIVTALYYLEYLKSENLNQYKSKYLIVYNITSFPIKAEVIDQAIDAQKLLLSQMLNEIEMRREELQNSVAINYFSSSIALASPLIKTAFKDNDLQPQRYLAIVTASMFLISGIALISIGSGVILLSLFFWYGFVKKFSKNSLLWKIVYGILVVILLGVVFSLDTFITLKLSNVLQQNNPTAFIKFMNDNQKAVIIIASNSQEVNSCAQKLFSNLPYQEKYLINLNNNQCTYNQNPNINPEICLQKVRELDYPTITFMADQVESYSFTLFPKPYAQLKHNLEYYKICVPEKLFTLR
ncbi:MAG: hypothetical protein N3E37_02575 [Candidatus Micrarchaeota archaeon]|nr:hypothetical protein [Candidatus Micrarchaeota archaeon]